MGLVKPVQPKRDCHRITASLKLADGGRTSVGHHQTISGKGIGRYATIAILNTRNYF